MEDSAKRRTVNFETTNDIEAQPVKIISDPGMAIVNDADGTVTPIVQIDVTDRPDIVDLFAAETPGVVGEHATLWGLRPEAPEGTVSLFLQFRAPVRLLVFMDFDVARQGFLIEEILRAQSLYIQAIRSASKEPLPSPSRIHVGVPDGGFRELWSGIAIDRLTHELRKQGFSIAEAKEKAAEITRAWKTPPDPPPP